MIYPILLSDFVPNSTFYRSLSGFHRTFATGVACRQGTLTPPDTWSRPFGTCMCSTSWDQSFFRTCRYFSGLCSSNIPRYFLDFALIWIYKCTVGKSASDTYIKKTDRGQIRHREYLFTHTCQTAGLPRGKLPLSLLSRGRFRKPPICFIFSYKSIHDNRKVQLNKAFVYL